MKINWSSKVKLWKIIRFYKFLEMEITAEELLNEVGYGFFCRSKDIITVVNSVKRGKVSCPRCGNIIIRSKYYWYKRRKEIKTRYPLVFCSQCKLELNWAEIKKILRRTQPRCFICGKPLKWDYLKNEVYCPECNQNWEWKQYRDSVSNRKWLPCPPVHARGSLAPALIDASRGRILRNLNEIAGI